MSLKEKILIVEDEFIVANDLRIMLAKAGYTMCGIASSVEQARELIALKDPDWVLLDITLKTPVSGIELAKELFLQKKPFLFISANTNQATLEAAKTTQPYGFLVKPFRERDLLVMLDIARYRYSAEHGVAENNTTVVSDDDNSFPDIIGKGAALKKALEKIRAVARSNSSVLLLGESGTGKERFAQAVHKASNRKNKPLVTVNCAALPLALLESELFGHERGAFTGAGQKRIGKFEQAGGGTIFLDEIGELSLEAQGKLLRVLQEREIHRLGGDMPVPVDVRVIAATNRNLEKEVAEGRFRLDLYYRLNVFPIALPPLRERAEDIPPLTAYFLKKFALALGKQVPEVSKEAMQSLLEHRWPGNIRELEHVIERQVILTMNNEITDFDLPVHLEKNPGSTSFETMEQMERNHIMNALKLCRGRVSGVNGAAEMLGLPAQTVYSKMKKHGIESGYK
ncbi:two-component system response regulator HydG [Chitinophaga sp. W3I9]|uniref:sigma 54-interacting transcriptional regulator n=1 Tax=Chitinophaga sp. W3I9 TaxID=3373924 RepID=UPI003D20135C